MGNTEHSALQNRDHFSAEVEAVFSSGSTIELSTNPHDITAQKPTTTASPIRKHMDLNP